jgi:hypothetical protein
MENTGVEEHRRAHNLALLDHSAAPLLRCQFSAKQNTA